MGESVAASLHTAAGVVRYHPAAHNLARVGLLARAVFYLVLTYLTLCLLVVPRQARTPADASGAMSTIARGPVGRLGLAVAAIGFLAFALVRLAAAWHDRDGAVVDRLTTCGQGLTYLLVAAVPATFLLGTTDTGSGLQEHQLAQHVLRLPGGRLVLTGVGLVLLLVCCWQIRGVTNKSYSRGFDLVGAPEWVRGSLHGIAAIGICARAFVFLPIGSLLLLAAVTDTPSRATGLNAELAALSGNTLGAAVLVLISVGFALFAVYSMLESRYKAMHSSM